MEIESGATLDALETMLDLRVPSEKLLARADRDEVTRESIRSAGTSARRGTIKQWDRGERADIKKETDVPSVHLATHVSTFVSPGAGTASKSITSDDVPMATSRNTHGASRRAQKKREGKIRNAPRRGRQFDQSRAFFSLSGVKRPPHRRY